jgi:hypothetical protein
MNPVPHTRLSIGVVYALAAADLVDASTPCPSCCLGVWTHGCWRVVQNAYAPDFS